MSDDVKKEESQDEDVLLKLSMPGKSLREEIITKQKETEVKENNSEVAKQETSGSISQELNKEVKEEKPQQIMTLEPERDNSESKLPIHCDNKEIEGLAKSVFYTDFGNSKKKRK